MSLEYIFSSNCKPKYFPAPRSRRDYSSTSSVEGRGCSGHRTEDEARVQAAGSELRFWIQTVWEEAPGSPSSLPRSGASGEIK